MSKILDKYKKILEITKKKNPSEEELEKLLNFIQKCSDLYYAPEDDEDTPLTDEEWDNLVKFYDEKSGKRYHSGSSKVVSGKKLVNLEHKFPDLVGTLYKAYSIAEVEEWMNIKLKPFREFLESLDKVSFVVSLKYDGNSAVGVYSNGICSDAMTRGKNGKGMSLFNIFKDHTINTDILGKQEIGVKYEVITTQSQLNEISRRKNKSYASARSVVAGILSSDGGEEFVDCLTFVPLKVESSSKDFSREEQLNFLQKISNENNSINFTYEKFTYKNFSDTDELIELFLKDLNKMYNKYIEERLTMTYMIDGLVIEILDEKIRHSLGRTGFENNFEVALKFPPMIKKSKITGMRFDTGKSNRITPVAIFEPIYFNGNKCEHVSLSNYKRFKELNLAIGDEVTIEYRGDVLSYLYKVKGGESGKKPIKFPTHCPDCKEKLKVTKNDKGEKIFVYCPNKKCPSGKKGKILNYVKKMDIKGIDESIINDLFANGSVTTISGLYRLTEDMILDIDGYKEKSAKNIIEAINSRKEVYDYELLGSLFIQNFGRDNAKSLLKEIDYDTLIYEIENGNDEFMMSRISSLNGFADKSAKYIVKGIKKNLKLIKKLEGYLTIKKIKEEIANKQKEMNIDPNLPKLKVVVTGDLKWGDRSEFKTMIENMGHKMVSAISSKVDILITNDPNSGTVKNKKAKELGIPVLTEEEAFVKLGIK